jgi:hypothetical protein
VHRACQLHHLSVTVWTKPTTCAVSVSYASSWRSDGTVGALAEEGPDSGCPFLSASRSRILSTSTRADQTNHWLNSTAARVAHLLGWFRASGDSFRQYAIPSLPLTRRSAYRCANRCRALVCHIPPEPKTEGLERIANLEHPLSPQLPRLATNDYSGFSSWFAHLDLVENTTQCRVLRNSSVRLG